MATVTFVASEQGAIGANAPMAVDDDPAPPSDAGSEAGDAAPVAPTPTEPTSANVLDPSVWEWSIASGSIAQFDALLIPGQASDQPRWPVTLRKADDSSATACADGEDFDLVYAAFDGATIKTFAVEGEIWEIRLLDPRTETELPLWC